MWSQNIVSDYNLTYYFFYFAGQDEQMVEVEEGNEHLDHEKDNLIAGDPVQSWVSSIESGEVAGGSKDKVVYGYDHNGNYVVLGVIIIGNVVKR